ncbi:MAG: hypothetical protein AcusKO_07860 [Acuticoccus sp.]
MLSVSEITRSLRGAAALFLGRSEGLVALDRSLSGFWRSFLAVLLVLPLDAITLLAIARTGRSEAGVGTLFMQHLPAVLIDWVAFPVLMALLARPLGVGRNYASYVVARNWCAPIAMAVLTIPYLLSGAGWVPQEGAALLMLIATLVVLRYHYVIVRVALQTPVGTSIGIVVADLLLSLVIGMLFQLG